MDITLVIPAHNEESILGVCLQKTIENARGAFKEIIVVDNASTDKTASIASKFPGVRVVYEPHKGLTYARQKGFEECKSELIAYLDADTYISKNWISIAEKVFTKYPDIASLSGPRRYFGAKKYKLLLSNAMWATAPLTYAFVGYMILGGNFITKRSAIEKIGGFDTGIAFYGEDTNLARRLSKVGKVMFRMDFIVYASARRFEQEGIFKANIVYMLNYFWPVLFNHPFSKEYKDVR